MANHPLESARTKIGISWGFPGLAYCSRGVNCPQNNNILCLKSMFKCFTFLSRSYKYFTVFNAVQHTRDGRHS